MNVRPKQLLLLGIILLASAYHWQQSAVAPAEKPFVGKQEYRVRSVIDGDTITVYTDGGYEKVRIIGIDAPELYPDEECAGDEARAFLDKRIAGQTVQLVQKPDEDTDQYDRWLRYVEFGGSDIGALLLGEGLAERFRKWHPREDEYRLLESEAKEMRLGMWSPQCN